MGIQRVKLDLEFCIYMTALFEVDKEFAFIYQQLKWIGLEDTINTNNLLEEVILDDDINTLEGYLDSVIGQVMLNAKDRVELIEHIGLIDYNHSNIKEDNIKYVKNIDTLNSYLLKELKIDYYIKEFETSRTIDSKRTKYKHAWKVLKLSEK
jgi:hypothetical protein